MKKAYIGVLCAAAVMAGCQEEQRSFESLDLRDQSEIDSQARSMVAQEQAALAAELEKAKASDPSIKDAYYSVNENGEKQLHIVHENEKGEPTSTVWPMLGGLAAGALLANMINMGGVNNYASYHRPAYVYHRSYEEERKRKNYATSGYVASTRSYVVKSYTPRYTRAGQVGRTGHTQIVTSSTSKGVFSSGSSARSGGYSFGG